MEITEHFVEKDCIGKERPYFESITERTNVYRQYYVDSLPPYTREELVGGESVEEEPIALYPEDRTMEGDFATLLAVYGEKGEECMFSRPMLYRGSHPVPRFGVYHKHQFIEIFYVVEGSFEQMLLGEHHKFTKGDVVITDQNCEHADYMSGNRSAVLFLQLMPNLLDSLLKSYNRKDNLQRFLFHALGRQKREQSFLALSPEWKQSEGQNDQQNDQQLQLEHLLEQLVEEDYRRGPGSDEIIRGNLIRFLQILCTTFELKLYSEDQESKEKVLLYELERFIRLNVATVTAASLEEHFFYHRNYYNLLLQKYRGKSFQQYVMEVRMGWAKELLEGTDDSVKKIAGVVGYENTTFFYKSFRKAYGMSPLECRKRKLTSTES